jgi:hypothetical protein
MPGANDRATDEHWAVVDQFNSLLGEFNELLEMQGLNGLTVRQVQFIGTVGVDDVERAIGQKQVQVSVIVSSLTDAESDIYDQDLASETNAVLQRINDLLADTEFVD